MRRAALAGLLLVLTGCITPPNQAQRLADTAFEMNHAARFGRLDLAMEQVGAGMKDDYARRHAAWGQGVRVFDVELTGIRWIDRSNADVSLRVSWLNISESDLRETQISQRWVDDRGKWLMMKEERASGSSGLWSEPPAKDRKGDTEESTQAAAPERRSFFRTKVIAGD